MNFKLFDKVYFKNDGTWNEHFVFARAIIININDSDFTLTLTPSIIFYKAEYVNLIFPIKFLKSFALINNCPEYLKTI